MPRRVEDPLLWRSGPYFDKRFLRWDGAAIYQIPAGDTLKAQIERGAPIVIEVGLPKNIMTLPTRAIELAIYPPKETFFAFRECGLAINAAGLLANVFEKRYRQRLSLVESETTIPRVSEAVAVFLMHQEAVKISGIKQQAKLLNPNSYSSFKWIVALSNRQGSRYVKVGNWNNQGIHINRCAANESVAKLGVAMWIVPKGAQG